MKTVGRTDVAAAANPRYERNHRLAARLGAVGGAVGVAAGLVQLTIGSRIPEWTGAKSSPVALGLLTVVLSLLAGWSALRQRDADLTTARRTACAAAILGTGLICSTTVGWLWWWLPAPLLFAAGALTVDRGRESLGVLTGNWARCLLVALAGCELVMAAGGGLSLLAAGALGGAGLLSVAWSRMERRTALVRVVVATTPLAVLGWTALAPVLVLLTGAAVVLLLERGPTRTMFPRGPQVRVASPTSPPTH